MARRIARGLVCPCFSHMLSSFFPVSTSSSTVNRAGYTIFFMAFVYANAKATATFFYIFFLTPHGGREYSAVVGNEFQTAIAALVERCHGNLSEAKRVSGLSVSLISDTLRGKGPADPKTATWQKLSRAMGHPAVVRERGVGYTDRYERLMIWLRLHPDAWPFVLNAAKGCGYVDR